MAEFDPSIISQIPDMAPNPQKATQDAYSLYDAKNRVQMNALTLQQAKQDQADQMATRNILKGSDLSTDKGVNEAAEKIAKVAPEQAMKFKQQMSQQKGVDMENQIKKYQAVEEQMTPIIGSVDSVIEQLAPMKKLYDEGKITKSDLDGMTIKKMAPEIARLKALDPQTAQYVSKWATPQNMSYDGLIATERSTKKGMEMSKQRLAETKEAYNETLRNKQVDQTDKRLDIQTTAMQSLVERRNEQNKNDEMSHVTPETSEFMADQYLHGDKSVLTGLGRTKGDMSMVRNSITKRAKEPIWGPNGDQPMTPGEVAAKIAQFGADMAEMRRISTVSGNVEFASQELKEFLPLAITASRNVPRGSFKPFNKLYQAGLENISDPALKTLYVNTQTVLNAYDVLGGRGGSDQHKRAENRKNLETADSPKAYEAAAKAIVQELEAASKAGPAAQAAIADKISGTKTKTDTSKTATAPKFTKEQQSALDFWTSK